MLRRRMGDDVFRAALARFYAEMRWKSASWTDLARVFSDVAKEDLRPFIAAWVDRPGAPTLALAVEHEGTSSVRIQVDQTQGGDPFPLRVSLALTVKDRKDAVMVEMDASAATQTKTFETPGPVRRVDLDPEFDVFRRLDAAEVPPTLGELFGADHVTIVLPAPDDAQAAAWRTVADAWKRSGGDVEVVEAAAFKALPEGRSVWILGAANPAGSYVAKAVAGFGASVATRSPARRASRARRIPSCSSPGIRPRRRPPSVGSGPPCPRRSPASRARCPTTASTRGSRSRAQPTNVARASAGTAPLVKAGR
jgi:hypothetical protein